MRPRLAAAAAAAILALLTGCVPAPPSQAPPAAPSAEATAPSPGSTASADDAEVVPAPEAADSSRQEAIAAATKVMEAFARPQMDADEWWRAMLPLLSQKGAYAYEGTDPAQIPVTEVTGAGIILDGSTEVLLIVEVPTDAGPYNVTLTRPDSSSPWLAERIRPAQD